MDLDIEYLAKLARIELTEAEKKKFSQDFEKILAHFKELQELDTEKVLPLTGGTNLANVLREDEVKEREESKKGRVQFPDKKDDFLRVPKVFE